MNIVLITNDSFNAKYLEKLILLNGINLVRVIRITQKNQNNKNLVNNITTKFRRKIGAAKRYLFQDSKTKKALKFEQICKDFYEKKYISYIKSKTENDLETGIKTLEVDDVNSDLVVSELRKLSPSICVVWGTPIIRKKVLDTCETFLNAHTSILPFFKGTKSEFWQCIQNRPETVGVTFHKIDQGVDTGPIIEQVYQKNLNPFEPFHLRYQNTIIIFENYPRIITSVILGTAKYLTQEKNEKYNTYKFSEITTSKRVELYHKLSLTKPKLN
tara:strand:- start:505 stop:1320 length:816 start_codon:yes stop_codon:yes gene_type:complete